MTEQFTPQEFPRLRSSFYVVGSPGTVDDGPAHGHGRARGFVTIAQDASVKELYADGVWYLPRADLFAEQRDAEDFKRKIESSNYGIRGDQPFVPFQTQAKFAFNAAELEVLRLEAIIQPLAISHEAAEQAAIIGALKSLDFNERGHIQTCYPDLFKMPAIDTYVHLKENESDDTRWAPSTVDQRFFKVIKKKDYRKLAQSQWHAFEKDGDRGYYRELPPAQFQDIAKDDKNTSYHGLIDIASELEACTSNKDSLLLAVRIVDANRPMKPMMQQEYMWRLAARALITERLPKRLARAALKRIPADPAPKPI